MSSTERETAAADTHTGASANGSVPGVPGDDPPRRELGAGLDPARMPGHFLLARVGKRVLRPGGRELTSWLVEQAGVGPPDRLVEFGPGLGVTAQVLLSRQPASYTGVERDVNAAEAVRERLGDGDSPREVVVGSAQSTGLPDGEASLVVGEAMLTMQRDQRKREIAAEAWRLLEPGGRYAIHELALVPEDIDPAVEEEISSALSREIHVGARPLTVSAWRDILTGQGFEVTAESTVPMALLEPGRMIRDEGPRMLRILFNLLRDREARQRVRGMRRVFRDNRSNLQAVGLVAVKPG